MHKNRIRLQMNQSYEELCERETHTVLFTAEAGNV